MNYPKISIITPNFNGAEYLEETILSILSQSYPNLEYIIIDGGSTDDSINIIKRHEDKIAYWVSEPDGGLYDAIQKGFNKSSGEIMAWLNSDDLYHRKSFFIVAEIFDKFQEVKWLQGIPSFIDEEGRTTSVDDFKRWSKLYYYSDKFRWIQQESTFWRRSLWDAAGGRIDVRMKFAADLDLWLRFFNYEKLYVTHALLAGFRQRSKNQLSLDNMDKYIAEAEDKIEYSRNNILSTREKKIIEDIAKLDKKINDIKNKRIYFFARRMYKKRRVELVNTYFPFPPAIYFNRSIQEFFLELK